MADRRTYECTVDLVNLTDAPGVELALFHGSGGAMVIPADASATDTLEPTPSVLLPDDMLTSAGVLSLTVTEWSLPVCGRCRMSPDRVQRTPKPL